MSSVNLKIIRHAVRSCPQEALRGLLYRKAGMHDGKMRKDILYADFVLRESARQASLSQRRPNGVNVHDMTSFVVYSSVTVPILIAFFAEWREAMTLDSAGYFRCCRYVTITNFFHTNLGR